MRQIVKQVLSLCLLSLSCPVVAQTASKPENKVTRSHARALYGTPKYSADFQAFAYVNPEASKGGTLRLGTQGTFDTFNDFASKGIAARISDFLYDSLMIRSRDEPYTVYGLIAEYIEYPDDNRWVRFRINPGARFADGVPITAKDVLYTFGQFNRADTPVYKSMLADVGKASIENRYTITFEITDPDNRMLPFEIAQLPVLPEHLKDQHDYSKADLSTPLGSGAYRIKSFEPGHQVILERIDNYWATQHPVKQGRYNFQIIQKEYFRSATVSLQAFLVGAYDIRVEPIAKNWATGYTGKEVENGKIIKTLFPRQNTHIQSFVFNTSRPQFQDRRVREAISQGYDFAWTNQTLMHNNYQQPYSLFANSRFGHRGKPSAAELELLTPFRKQLPEKLFLEPWRIISTSGDGLIRQRLRVAQSLLEDSGWVLQNHQRVHKDNKTHLAFELLLVTPEQERIALPFARNLEHLGISMRIKVVDMSQYIQRVRNKDYDMLLRTFGHGSTPGSELRQYWHSQHAGEPGSRNLANVANPAIDSLLDRLKTVTSQEELYTITSALDRIVLWEHYVIPQLQNSNWRIAYQNRLGFPAKQPLFGFLDFSVWWENNKQ